MPEVVTYWLSQNFRNEYDAPIHPRASLLVIGVMNWVSFPPGPEK